VIERSSQNPKPADASPVVMPRLSDVMEEGTIIGWLVASGAAVEEGEPLVEIETDKATLTYDAPASGIVTLIESEGTTVKVGSLIAYIGTGIVSTAAVAPHQEAGHHASVADQTAADQPSGQVERPASVIASPVARRLAAEHNVDLQTVTGTGPNNRITRSDVEAALGRQSAPAVFGDEAAAAQAPVDSAKGQTRREPLTRAQAVIARRMSESRATIPDFVVQVEVDIARSRTPARRSGTAPTSRRPTTTP
jgi:pyruvate dehydrogenase E2 component (dihydrolipoamide acetyltransferase)